jgi:hypothetical protein
MTKCTLYGDALIFKHSPILIHLEHDNNEKVETNQLLLY